MYMWTTALLALALLPFSPRLPRATRNGRIRMMGLEEQREAGRKGHAATLQTLIDRGEAATMEEAQQLLGKKAHAAAAANHPLGETGYSMNGGVAAALAQGKYTRYPGVRWRPDSSKWRVQFSYKGKKLSLGSHLTEEAAARAHDAYVRANGLDRPLHFPEEGENSSGMFREGLEARAAE